MTWLAVLGIVATLGTAFWLASKRYVRSLFRSANEAEGAGEFEQAVYHYGEALYHRHPLPETCRTKIRELWRAYGPFRFAAQRSELTRRTDIDRDGDLETFDDVVRVIEQVAAGQKEKRHYEV
jgi:hypothetical protein